MDNEESLAMLQRENDCVFVKNVPFTFGRKHEKSPPDFMDICVDGIDKTVSREYAIITYSEEKKTYLLQIKGKQGAYVNKQFVMRGETCCIYNGDAISLLKCKFYFLLPKEAMDPSEPRASVKRSSEVLANDAVQITDLSLNESV